MLNSAHIFAKHSTKVWLKNQFYVKQCPANFILSYYLKSWKIARGEKKKMISKMMWFKNKAIMKKILLS